MKTKQSAHYKTGYENAMKSFYWTRLFAADLRRRTNPENKLAFANGYYDALADKYGMKRSTHFSDVNEIPVPLADY